MNFDVEFFYFFIPRQICMAAEPENEPTTGSWQRHYGYSYENSLHSSIVLS